MHAIRGAGKVLKGAAPFNRSPVRTLTHLSVNTYMYKHKQVNIHVHVKLYGYTIHYTHLYLTSSTICFEA